MAAVRSQEATSSMSQCAYHVFLSFGGEDTRKKFTDHLYTALIGAGFRTFRDDDEIDRGENIKSEMRKAIKQSRVSIVVLSQDYASSGWCLDELVLILEHKRTSKHVVLPVFYDVDPSQVRKQTGGFAEAFARHEEKFKVETDARKNEWMGKLKGWREALTEIADLGGMVLQNQADGHESMFIQKVVKVVGDKLNRTPLSVAPYLIGIVARVRNIKMWLQDESTQVGIMIIQGMGGIGKTTAAKLVYNLSFERFEGSSFLANVREFSEQPDGLIRLQNQLLSDILKGRKEKVCNIDEGIIKIKDALCCKKVLLVLDDVDRRDQLDAILGMQDWFYPGSKIILTTRHERLLKAHEVYKVHEVEKLTFNESLELFSWHAFGQNHPIEGYMEHSRRVVNYCGGLPLALQVLGSSLSGRSVDIWESALEKLEIIPDSHILKKLKISYDALQDDHDKNLFLDIACFFVGEDKDCIKTILDGCDFYTTIGLHNLIDRCLLTINEHKKVTMHQLLRDMGREIIRQESPKEPGKRSRLWRHNDTFKVLREKTGTETLEGLSLSLLHETFFSVNNAKRRHSEDFLDGYKGDSSKRLRLGAFSWLSMYSFPTESISSLKKVDFQTNAFSRMHKLRLLQLNNVRLIGSCEYLPHNIRWCCWRGFSLKSLPDMFPLENLVCLDMQNSSLEQVWKGTKCLKLLKILNLSYSHMLRSTPDFSELPNLERLSLEYCINLTEIHESIGELERLLLLNLGGCKNLQKLPRNIGQLKSLEEIILSGCSKLNELPTELLKMEYLKILHADGISFYKSPSSTGEMKSLGTLFWSWMSKPRKNPESVSFSLASLSRSLVNISLADCNLSDDALPRDLGSLSLLQKLNLSGNKICSLPESIKSLTMLETLGLKHCKRLQSLPELPLSLTDLDLFDCTSLEMVTNLPNVSSSLELLVNDCRKLVEAHGLFKLEPVGNMDAKTINILGLVYLEYMEKFEVQMFSNLSITKRKGPLQGLSEFGIFSIFLPGSEVPGWFGYKSTASSIRFNVPSFPNMKIIGMKICIIYAYASARSKDSRNKYWDEFYIKISNKTKNLKWIYSPTFIGIPDDGKDMTWLCHWKFGNHLEGGDDVNISVFVWAVMQLKGFGIHVVCEQEDPSCQNVSDVADLSAYEVRTGSFFLCHHDFDVVQVCSMGDGWTTTGWYDFFFGDSVPSNNLPRNRSDALLI